MEVQSRPSLLSTSKNSDSRLEVQLHPLVILTISDYVTRHTVRELGGPVVGAIIGAQNGRDITMEHAFECKLETGSDGEALIDAGWFHDRLQQYRDVHKAPALDFVAWFTLAPPSGPQTYHLPIHQQFLQNYNESILLLALHPSAVSGGASSGGKLPLTIYETVFETSGEGDDRGTPRTAAAPAGDGPQLVLRFQELPYTIETGEAEMIAVDFVARGGASAASAKSDAAPLETPTKESSTSKGKGKGKAATKSPESQVNGSSNDGGTTLSLKAEEAISSLTAKANAIRMLQQRLNLIKAYLNSLPPCYLNTPSVSGGHTPVEAHPQISHPVLRTVASLLARLPLLTPTSSVSTGDVDDDHGAAPTPHAQESQTLRTDVALTSLLGGMGSALLSAQEMAHKAHIVEHSRAVASSKNPSAGRRMGLMQASSGNIGRSGGGGGGSDHMAVEPDGDAYFDAVEEEVAQKEFSTSLSRRR